MFGIEHSLAPRKPWSPSKPAKPIAPRKRITPPVSYGWLSPATNRFSVSPERQKSLEDELIQEALTAFRARAELIRKSLERRSYAIVHISIGHSGRPPERPMRAAAQSLSLEKVAPPALEGGSSTLKVGVSATIELD